MIIQKSRFVKRTSSWEANGLKPDGGDAGGRLVAQGKPQVMTTVGESYTGRYLQAVL